MLNLGELFDHLLRNHSFYFKHLAEGSDAGVQVLDLIWVIFLLSGLYGLIMGVPGGFGQAISSAIKVPLLFVLNTVIGFPVLYVITVLVGSQLPFLKMMAIILFAIGVTSILLASFSTIVLFFEITGSGYNFMKLMHVVVFAFSGFWGMTVLWHGLYIMSSISGLYPKWGLIILMLWIVIYAFVGAQLAWTLRPFIGNPKLPFELMRKRGSNLNFYTAIALSMREIERNKKDSQANS